MAHINAGKVKPEYDVIIIGSGVKGGQVAYVISTKGVNVLMLESGRNYDPAKETSMFNTSQQASLRRDFTPDKPSGFMMRRISDLVTSGISKILHCLSSGGQKRSA